MIDADFINSINQKRLHSLQAIAQVPIAALIWGPNPSLHTPVAICRKALKETLATEGVYACYSEELYDPKSRFSNFAQQVAQAEAFDIVISIPDSPGSIAEIHDFAIIPSISPKIVTFLDNSWNGGYSNSTLLQLQSVISCRVQLYDAAKLPDCIIDESKKMIATLREIFYVIGRRKL